MICTGTISAIGAAPKRSLVLAPAKKPSSSPRFHTANATATAITAHEPRPHPETIYLTNTLISYSLFTRPLPILPVFASAPQPDAVIIFTGVQHLHHRRHSGPGLISELKPSSRKASLAYHGEADCTVSFDVLHPTEPPSFSHGSVRVTFEDLKIHVEDFLQPHTSPAPPPTYSRAEVRLLSMESGTSKKGAPAVNLPSKPVSLSFLVDVIKGVNDYIPLATITAEQLRQDSMVSSMPVVRSFLAHRRAFMNQHKDNAAPKFPKQLIDKALRAFFDGSLEDSGRISHERGVIRNSGAYRAGKVFFPSLLENTKGSSAFLLPVYDEAIKFLRKAYKDDEDTPDDASFLQSFEEGLARAEFPDALSFNVGESVMSGGLASVKFEGLEVKSYTTEHENVYFNTLEDRMWIHVPGVKLSFKGHGVAAKAEFEFNGEIEEKLVLTAVVKLDRTTLEPTLTSITYGEGKIITGEIVSKSMLGAVLVKPANAMLQSRLKTSEFQEAFRKAFKEHVFEEAKELGIAKPIRKAIKSIVRGYTELYVRTNNAKVRGLHR